MFQKQYLFLAQVKKDREALSSMGLLGRLILIICDSADFKHKAIIIKYIRAISQTHENLRIMYIQFNYT